MCRTLLFIAIMIASTFSAFGQNIERMFQTDVKIYLRQSGVAPNGPSDLFVRPVERMVPNDFKLDYALAALFDEQISADEEEAGFSSSTFGMKLEGVTLRRGIATIRVSQPEASNDHGPLAPMVFVEAVTKTARQFSFVKRVRICAVGKTTIDAELERPLPRCSSRRPT